MHSHPSKSALSSIRTEPAPYSRRRTAPCLLGGFRGARLEALAFDAMHTLNRLRGVSMSPPHSPRISRRTLESPPASPRTPPGQRCEVPPPPPKPEETPDNAARQVKDADTIPPAPSASKQARRSGGKIVRTHSLHGSVHVHVAVRKGRYIEKEASPSASELPPADCAPLSCPHECGFSCGSAQELDEHLQVRVPYCKAQHAGSASHDAR